VRTKASSHTSLAALPKQKIVIVRSRHGTCLRGKCGCTLAGRFELQFLLFNLWGAMFVSGVEQLVVHG